MWYLRARHFEKTDDAFIDTRTIQISPQINGYLVAVPVDDNQLVEKGAVLARLDRRDYQAAVDQAIAQREQAIAMIANYDAQRLRRKRRRSSKPARR